MNPGEAERKLHALEEEHEETLRVLAVFREFFEASYAMNVAAAALPSAERVRTATNACATEKIRAEVSASAPKESALDALKRYQRP